MTLCAEPDIAGRFFQSMRDTATCLRNSWRWYLTVPHSKPCWDEEPLSTTPHQLWWFWLAAIDSSLGSRHLSPRWSDTQESVHVQVSSAAWPNTVPYGNDKFRKRGYARI